MPEPGEDRMTHVEMQMEYLSDIDWAMEPDDYIEDEFGDYDSELDCEKED